MADMTHQAERWVLAHPAETVKLTIRRIYLLFFPTRYMMSWIPVLHTAVWYLFIGYGALKLLALVRVLTVGPRRFVWLVFTMLPLAPYAISFVNVRYSYIVFFPSICMIAVALSATTTTSAADDHRDAGRAMPGTGVDLVAGAMSPRLDL